jgi:hypothetical protein
MKEEKLRQLLNKYYDGNTSPAEEKELKEYFSGNEILQGYEAEKDIFRHYTLSERIPSDDFEKRIIQAVDDLEIDEREKIIRMRYISALSAAAAILILVGSWFIFFQEREPADSFSDPQIAYAETMKILNYVSVKLNRGTIALQPISKINSTARISKRSIDRSVSAISYGLKRIGLSGKIAGTEEIRNKETEK